MTRIIAKSAVIYVGGIVFRYACGRLCNDASRRRRPVYRKHTRSQDLPSAAVVAAEILTP